MTTSAQDTVERMIVEGSPFEDIEQFIETLMLPGAQLSALWLLAWAEATDSLTRRQVVAEVLAGDDRPRAPLLAACPARRASSRTRARPSVSQRRGM